MPRSGHIDGLGNPIADDDPIHAALLADDEDVDDEDGEADPETYPEPEMLRGVK